MTREKAVYVLELKKERCGGLDKKKTVQWVKQQTNTSVSLRSTLLWRGPNVEHVVAAHQHFAQLAGQLSVDVLLGGSELLGGDKERVSLRGRADFFGTRRHATQPTTHLQVHVGVCGDEVAWWGEGR